MKSVASRLLEATSLQEKPSVQLKLEALSISILFFKPNS